MNQHAKLYGSACRRWENERAYYQNSCLITGGKRLHGDTLMESLSYEILQNWQVRKTRKQKLAFVEMMQSRIPGLRVEEGGFLHCRNLVLGDVEAAKVVFTAHYDTCARLPFPNFVTPKNIVIYLGYSLLISLPFLVLMFGLTLLLGPWFGAAGAFLGMLIGLGAMFYVFFLGAANPHTVNDNTSGVLTLVEAIARMSEEERARCAFIFFDHEENGLLGSGWFASKHKKTMKDKLLVNFDCVSDGDDFLFVLSRKARKGYSEALRAAFAEYPGKKLHFESTLSAFYPSDQANFPVGVGVAALRKKPVLGLYVSRIHTSKDTVLQEENLAYLAEGTKKLVSLL